MELQLPAQAGEHLVRVLRLERGHPIILFNGDGNEYKAELVQLAKQAVVAKITSEGISVDRESPLDLTLAQGIARGEKMDMILQKATELGVRKFVPLITSRTEVKLDVERSARRVAHWRAIIAGACEQSGRAHLPDLAEPIRLGDWVAQLDDSAGLRLALDPNGKFSPRDLPVISSAVLVVGPEGGLSEQDMTQLAQSEFQGLRLGPRILRTETAGLAAVAALQVMQGDFG